jgi:hypothetical protein
MTDTTHEISQHTPGPWRIRGGLNGDGTVEAVTNNRGVAWPIDIGTDEGEANARLIAAAPELLAALKNVRLYLAKHEHLLPPVSFNGLDAAIAAAEGR